MRAIKRVRAYLERYPGQPSSAILCRLVVALSKETEFPLADLYRLDRLSFDLAMELLEDWRLDRNYAERVEDFNAVRNRAVAALHV